MIAERLKKAVLQAAIQGKLTEQLPEDGDAKDLLREIQKDKARLIKEGKLKKDKPFPEITEDEKPFDIPENWCWARLGDVFNLQAGKFMPAQKIRPFGNYPCFGGNGQRGYVDIYNWSGRLPLIGRQGALCGNINIAEGDFYATEHAVVVELFSGSVPDWAAYTLEALNLNQYSTATAQPGLSVNKINRILIPVPPIAQQKIIVNKIRLMFCQIEELKTDETKLEELQKTFLKKMKDSLLQYAIQGKLTEQLPEDGNARDLLKEIKKDKVRLIKEGKIKKDNPLPDITEDEKPFDIPENWCWVRLGDIGETNIGLTYSPFDITTTGTLVLRSGNIQGGKLDYNDSVFVNCGIPESKKCHLGDILICARNGSKRLVGKTAVIDREGMSFGAFMALFRSPFNDYVYKYFSSPYFRADFDGVGTTTINQITQENLKHRLLPLPPLSEQKRIVERLEELLPLCETLE